MKQNQKSQAERDQEIISVWESFEESEPDISTERLFGMVENVTGATIDRQIEALKRTGKIT